MTTTPTYEAIVDELQIDPEEIGSREPWSLEAATRRLEQAQI